MNGIYECTLQLGIEHVDRFRRMRTSALFTVMQSASLRHITELGLGREKTFDRGLVWVVARQRAVIDRMPVYDERVTLRTWPGEMKRVLFPRYYELIAENGETLARGSALWSLMDAQTRTAAFPDEYGAEIAGVVTGRELPCVSHLLTMETTDYFEFPVTQSYVDLNGHINNARCFDVAEDRLPLPKQGAVLREAQVEYNGEARLDDLLVAEWGERDGEYYVNAMTDSPCFRMRLRYGMPQPDGSGL